MMRHSETYWEVRVLRGYTGCERIRFDERHAAFIEYHQRCLSEAPSCKPRIVKVERWKKEKP
jgi:hypothetical protein